MNRTLPLVLALLVSAPAHAGVVGIMRLDIHAAQKCACDVTGLPCPEMPEIVFASEWSKPSDDSCCGSDGKRSGGDRRYSYHDKSTLSINVMTGSRTVTLYQSAGFEQAVHELAADAFVQAGGNKWDVNARERVGYAAAWASDDCKH